MAGIKRGGHVDYQRNEIRNVVVQNLSSAPSSPQEGLVYYDTTLHEFGYWNGTAWIYSATTPDATASTKGVVQLAGDLAGTGSTAAAPTVGNLHLTADTAVNHKLTALTSGTNPGDAVNLGQVQALLNGLSWKQPVACATYAALPAYTQAGAGVGATLTATVNGALVVDGYAVQLNDRVLVTQSTAIQPDGTTGGGAAAAKDAGIYTLTTLGTGGVKFVLTRAVDDDTTTKMQDAAVLVMQGATNADVAWNLSNAPGFTVDTTALSWVLIQNATVVTGDGVYTTRTANQIKLLPVNTTPTTPANGAASAASLGAARVAKFALAGDNSTTVFTCTHNWGTYELVGNGQVQSAGNPANPIELDWAPSSANAVQITFPIAPGSGVVYYFMLVG